MPIRNGSQEGVKPRDAHKNTRIGRITELLEEVRKLTDSSEIIEKEGTEFLVVGKGDLIKLLDTIEVEAQRNFQSRDSNQEEILSSGLLVRQISRAVRRGKVKFFL